MTFTLDDDTRTGSNANMLSSLPKTSSFGSNMFMNGGTGVYESLIQKIQKKIANKQHWFSLEFFPPKTVNGAANLIAKCEAKSKFNRKNEEIL